MTILDVQILTWNLGGSLHSVPSWESEVKSWDIFDENKDIIFMTFQEGSERFGDIMNSYLHQRLPHHNIFHHIAGAFNFHVLGYLCIKKTIRSGKVEYLTYHDNTTKPTIGIRLHKLKVLFICSHLPISFKDKYMGYYDRIWDIRQIKSQFMKYDDLVFWAGDLNFRIVSGKDQFSRVLERNLTSFKEMPITFQPTCKYVTYTKGTDLQQFIMFRYSGKGYNKHRTPSYCDRIVYQDSGGAHFIPHAYTTLFPLQQPSVVYSDHQPVVLDGYIVIL